jgi:hypothetical protein
MQIKPITSQGISCGAGANKSSADPSSANPYKSRKKEFTLFCLDLSPFSSEPLPGGSRAWKSHERFGL